MYLIDQKGARVRPVCGYCQKPTADGEYARPRNRKDKGWVCFACADAVMEEALSKHQQQIEDGVPFAHRYTEIPLDFLPLTSDRWMTELRLAIKAAQQETTEPRLTLARA